MLGAILGGVGLLGSLFGKAGQGQAQERTNQNNAATDLYRTQQSALANLLGQQQQANVQRAQMGIQAPQARTRQALLGSLLQNLQPARVTPPAGVNMPQMSGGMTPAAINGAARQGGAELQRQALIALLTGSDMPQQIDFVKQGMVQAPTLKQPGKLESALGLAGLLGAGASGLSAMGVGGARPNPVAQLPASWSGRA